MPRKRRRGLRRDRRPRPAQRTRCAYCGLHLEGRQARHCPDCDLPTCLTCAHPSDHDCLMAEPAQPSTCHNAAVAEARSPI